MVPRKYYRLTAVLLALGGCGAVSDPYLPNESTEPVDDRFTLLARIVHISDAHVTDEESPARLTAFADFTNSAWRPQEAYSTQLVDGTIRTINKLHVTRGPIDFVVHTGDAVDNNQSNEWNWFVQLFEGGMIDPRSGPDDRDPSMIPDPLLDPHHPFAAQGLYRQGVHGSMPTIRWFDVFGNHDHFAVGVFPIIRDWFGNRVSPLPLQNRIGLVLPVRLNPIGDVGWGVITPAFPGPPAEFNFPTLVEPNPERRYSTWGEAISRFEMTATTPDGHGFNPMQLDQTWYSVSPVPGLRLIALNSSTPLFENPTFVYSEGAISFAQVQFLRRELDKADANDEIVIVATHHPASSLHPLIGTALVQDEIVDLLNEHRSVRLHLAGHWHRNAVIDRSGYREIVTGSIIDAPQQGRIIEIWRDGEDVELRYHMFSHLDSISAPDDSVSALFDDPLLPMRRAAADLAGLMQVPGN